MITLASTSQQAIFHQNSMSTSSEDFQSHVASGSRVPYPPIHVVTADHSTDSTLSVTPHMTRSPKRLHPIGPPAQESTTNRNRPWRNRWSTTEGLGWDHSRSTECGILGIGDIPLQASGQDTGNALHGRGSLDQDARSERMHIAIERRIRKRNRKHTENVLRRYANPYPLLNDVSRVI